MPQKEVSRKNQSYSIRNRRFERRSESSLQHHSG